MKIINNETFKEIPGFNDYLCSQSGKIYSEKTNKILKVNYNTGKMQYPTIGLYSSKNICIPVHKLIALTWCDFPKGFSAKDVIGNWMKHNLVVDHIDGNKMNFEASNLRWCTPFENVNYNNFDRIIQREGKVGNQYAKGRTIPKNQGKIHYIYHYNNKNYTITELCNELNCSKSKITESFRSNFGLVRLGKLTRTPILTKKYQLELIEELETLIKTLGENINDENNIDATRAREIIEILGWNKGDKND